MTTKPATPEVKDKKPKTPPKKVLTDPAVRNAKVGAHADGTVRGLFLIVTPAGSRSWRLRYWINTPAGSKEHTHTLGIYSLGTPSPARHLSLDEARQAARSAKAGVSRGEHPKDAEKVAEAVRKATEARTFSAVAKEFVDHTKVSKEWTASTDNGIRYALKPINKVMGPVPITLVSVDHIKEILAHHRGKRESQRFALSVVRRVLAFAKVSRYVTENVAVGCEELLPIRKKGQPRHKHYPAITDPVQLKEFLHRLDAITGHSSAIYGLRLLMLLPVRPVELATMKWADLETNPGFWVFTMSKVHRQHIVPLPRQALVILEELRARRAGQCEYVLPRREDATLPIGADGLRLAITKQLKYPVGVASAHGFRACFETCAIRDLGADAMVVTLSTGHETPAAFGGAYDRRDLLQERIELAQRYADWLDELRLDDDRGE
ncbi:tyrosine-type recombinase/integrase [Pseudomonas fluorescens]|uniref:Prophage integrase IntS n=1 Tax=Pseudomonas fluorescens TaxID=294 RepID=A0A5E7EZ16_PSEFL|nr:integrase arm-type DNA-binding domain-containing protein [Pseudomonas fluorescens]VVO32066.1 Prophage integrase IntS [Pseudomonas fluorescens]